MIKEELVDHDECGCEPLNHKEFGITYEVADVLETLCEHIELFIRLAVPSK